MSAEGSSTVGNKQYSIQRITVPSLGQVPVRYDFQPDQVTVVSETPVVNPMDVYPDGASGGSSLPLYAMGPLVFPGVSFPQSLLIKNNDISIRTIRVIAQKGYLPTQIVPPTTLIIPESAYPQSQTRHEFFNINYGTPVNYMHQHVGSDIIVMVGIGETSTGVDGDIIAVNIGGVAANLLGRAHIWGGGGNPSSALGWYLRANVPEGNTQISTVLSVGTNDDFYSMAFSYAAGIRTGNISLQSYWGAAPPLFNIIGQEIGSVIMCGAIVTSGVAFVIAETSGAPEFDPPHNIAAACSGGIWRRAGIGTHPFDFAVAGNSALSAAALEVLPRI